MIESKDFKVLLVYPNLSMMLTPSYAVGLFTAILKDLEYHLDFFDCTPYLATYEFMKEPLPVTRANRLLNSRKFDAESVLGQPKADVVADFRDKITECQPHAIIFSTVVEDTWPQLQELLKVTSEFLEIKTIAGGVFATMAPEVMIKNEHIQCIGLGEGEEIVSEFCEKVRKGESTTDIPGTWAKGEDGSVIRNRPRTLGDINKETPADFSLFDERRFMRPLGAKIWKTLPLETYRGCPYRCTFCNSPAQVDIAAENGQGNFLRRKTMDTLRDHIKLMIDRYQPEFFYVNDDAFMARPKSEIHAFADMYEEFQIPFWFQTRFENVDDENLKRLKEVGCYRISFGLEHGNEEYRREKLHRNIKNSTIVDKARIVKESGIPYTVNIIIGFPYETRELLFESVQLCKEVDSFDSLSVNIFVPYHGTHLRRMALKEKWLDPNRQTTSVIAESILEMPKPYLHADEILGLQRTFPLYVRFDEDRYPEIRIAEQNDEEGNETFRRLSEEFFEMTYGMDEENRMLSYVG